MENIFESTAENTKAILNEQKENMEEFNNIVPESLMGGFAIKKETEEYSAFSRYKNLIEEVERLSKTNPNLSRIPDIFRTCIRDIDESNKQLQISKYVQMMADSVMKRGNSFVYRMIRNYTEIKTSSSKGKQNTENPVESSKRLSEIADSKMPDYHQFLKNDLLKRLAGMDSEETITRSGANFNGTDTMISLENDSEDEV